MFVLVVLVHLSTTCELGAKEDLKMFVETFFQATQPVAASADEDDSKPTIIYSAFFEIPSSQRGINLSENQTGPIYTCCGPFPELDYDDSIKQTRLLYEKMYPGEEFLPKAPEPEEIIIGDEDATEASVNLGTLTDLVPGKEEEAANLVPADPSKDEAVESEET